MNKTPLMIGALAALALSVAAPRGAFAQDGGLDQSIERFLADVQEQVDGVKILDKIRVRPSLRQSVIWTDNIFLNDRNEDPVRVLSVVDTSVNPNVVFFNPLRAPLTPGLRKEIRELQERETAGRVDDGIIQTELNLDFELPVNQEKEKLFDADSIKLLGINVKNQEYMTVNELDNTGFNLSTDLFSFLSDLLDFRDGNRIWVRTRAEHRRTTDPLNAEIPLLEPTRISNVDRLDDFQRTETTINLDVGYVGGRFDAEVGYEDYHLMLDDAALEQAAHTRRGAHVELGMELPWWAEKRGYARYDFWDYRFHLADVASPQQVLAAGRRNNNRRQILNNAEVHRVLFGVEGLMFSRRIQGAVEAGYMAWRSQKGTGLSGDNNQFNQAVGGFRFAYKPHEERQTVYQISYNRTAAYSAISNFNATHEAEFSVLHEFIERKLDGDLTLSFTRTTPSDGPTRDLYGIGAGLTYHLYEQMDVTFRYLFRVQVGSHEIVNQAAFSRKGLLVNYLTRSDGDFYQSVLELGVNLHF